MGALYGAALEAGQVQCCHKNGTKELCGSAGFAHADHGVCRRMRISSVLLAGYVKWRGLPTYHSLFCYESCWSRAMRLETHRKIAILSAACE